MAVKTRSMRAKSNHVCGAKRTLFNIERLDVCD